MLAVMKGTKMADKMVVDLAARMVGKMELLMAVKLVDLKVLWKAAMLGTMTVVKLAVGMEILKAELLGTMMAVKMAAKMAGNLLIIVIN